MTEEALRKRREREERKAAAAAVAASKLQDDVFEPGSPSAGQPQPASKPTEDSSAAAGPSSTAAASTTGYTVTIPTSSTSVSWYRPHLHSYETLSAAREAGIWTYPSTPEEHARCGVFRALWEKGYYMGCGVKFGGEYLVYPGECGYFDRNTGGRLTLESRIEQATPYVITRTSQPPYSPLRARRYGLWRSLHTAGSAQRRRRRTFSAVGILFHSRQNSFLSNGPALAETRLESRRSEPRVLYIIVASGNAL